MRVVEATENCAVPEEVESDSVRVAASYFSMMPRKLRVVKLWATDWVAVVGTAPTPCPVGRAF